MKKQRCDIINERDEQSKAKQSTEAQAISDHKCPQRPAATKSKKEPTGATALFGYTESKSSKTKQKYDDCSIMSNE